MMDFFVDHTGSMIALFLFGLIVLIIALWIDARRLEKNAVKDWEHYLEARKGHEDERKF